MATEQHLRQQLGAAYRLAALFGWEDTLYTHFSVRLPGDGEPRFLINPFGMMFDEVTASNLIVVDMQGKDTKDGSGRFSALSSCDSPRQDDLDDVDYHFDVDDVDTPVSQPRYV